MAAGRAVAIERNEMKHIKEGAVYVQMKRLFSTYYRIAWKLEIGEWNF
jgi:hypothetical protein